MIQSIVGTIFLAIEDPLRSLKTYGAYGLCKWTEVGDAKFTILTKLLELANL